MLKLASALILSSLTVFPASADPVGASLDFTRDNIHYVGTIVDSAAGERLIVGHEVGTGRAFTLNVAGGQVTGVYDGQPVSYSAPKPRTLASFLTADAR